MNREIVVLPTNFIYTGIGSRDIPDVVFVQMMVFAYQAASAGGTLRSGKAIGSDTAFQLGHEMWLSTQPHGPCRMEIYTVNDQPDNRRYLSSVGEIEARDNPMWETFCLKKCKEIHPIKNRLKGKALDLHGRNILQVVGEDCLTLSDMCVYFARKDQYGKLTGGTATAATFAQQLNIPSYNICADEGDESVRQLWFNYIGTNFSSTVASDGFRSALQRLYRLADSAIKHRIQAGFGELNQV